MREAAWHCTATIVAYREPRGNWTARLRRPGGRASGDGWVLAAVGLVPLGAAAADVCLLAPLFHAPLRPRAH